MKRKALRARTWWLCLDHAVLICADRPIVGRAHFCVIEHQNEYRMGCTNVIAVREVPPRRRKVK